MQQCSKSADYWKCVVTMGKAWAPTPTRSSHSSHSKRLCVSRLLKHPVSLTFATDMQARARPRVQATRATRARRPCCAASPPLRSSAISPSCDLRGVPAWAIWSCSSGRDGGAVTSVTGVTGRRRVRPCCYAAEQAGWRSWTLAALITPRRWFESSPRPHGAFV